MRGTMQTRDMRVPLLAPVSIGITNRGSIADQLFAILALILPLGYSSIPAIQAAPPRGR